MKKRFFLGCFFSLFCITLQAQTTYPVDSCLYFMTPSDFLIRGIRTVGTNSQETLIVFRSSSSSDPNIAFSGRGSFVVDKNDLPAGMDLTGNTRGNMLLTIEAAPEESTDWPGGSFTYPSLLSGYLESAGGIKLNTPLPVTVQLIEFEYSEFTE